MARVESLVRLMSAIFFVNLCILSTLIFFLKFTLYKKNCPSRALASNLNDMRDADVNVLTGLRGIGYRGINWSDWLIRDS